MFSQVESDDEDNKTEIKLNETSRITNAKSKCSLCQSSEDDRKDQDHAASQMGSSTVPSRVDGYGG